MPRSSHFMHKGISKFFSKKKIFIFLVLWVLSIIYGIVSPPSTDSSGGGEGMVYKDKYAVPPDEKFDVVDYQVKFYTTDFDKKSIDLKIKLLEKEIEDSYRLLLDMDQMTPWQLGVTADPYNDPNSYFTQYSEGYYKRLYNNDSEVLDRTVALIDEIAESEALNAMDTINFVISLVQNIEYEIPKINDFEVLSPVLSLDYRYGDCDTKTLLMLITLRKLGVDCIHLESTEYAHAMIGINVAATGDYLEYGGKKYYFLETTSPGWEIGILPPDCNNLNYWYALNY